MLELALGRVLELAPGRVLELAPGQVLGLELVLGQVLGLGLRIPRPPFRLTGPRSLPKKIIFYSISSSFKKWDLNLPTY